MVVGQSGRVWAWGLRPPAGEEGSAGEALDGPQAGSSYGPGEEQQRGRVGRRRGKRKLQPGPGGEAEAGHSMEEEGEEEEGLYGAQQAFPLTPDLAAPWGAGALGAQWAPASSLASTPPLLHVRSEPLLPPAPAAASGVARDRAGAASLGGVLPGNPRLAAEEALAGEFEVRGVASPGGRAQLVAQVAWEYLEALLPPDGKVGGLAVQMLLELLGQAKSLMVRYGLLHLRGARYRGGSPPAPVVLTRSTHSTT
jgi:hypothetical protein